MHFPKVDVRKSPLVKHLQVGIDQPSSTAEQLENLSAHVESKWPCCCYAGGEMILLTTQGLVDVLVTKGRILTVSRTLCTVSASIPRPRSSSILRNTELHEFTSDHAANCRNRFVRNSFTRPPSRILIISIFKPRNSKNRRKWTYAQIKNAILKHRTCWTEMDVSSYDCHKCMLQPYIPLR